MTLDETPIRELARERDGLVSWREARAHGFTWRSIATRVQRGAWARIGHALVIHDLHRPGDRATAWLLHLHCGPASAVSGPIAARLQGWTLAGADNLVINPQPVAPPPGHSLRVLRRADPIRANVEGLPPLVPRVDALVDTLTARSPQGARDLLDHALQRRWITPVDLERVMLERSGPAPRGQKRLRELYERATTGSRSQAEQRMGLLISRIGEKGWISNYPVRDEAGRIVAEIDFAHPGLKIAIEVDGRAFHSGRQSFERDRERQNMLVVRGWVVLRFTWERIVNDPDGVLAEIAAACAVARQRIRAQTA